MLVTMERKQNRLANEKSPYLLQHKMNPVDWYPWCEEAFDKAKKEDKPIFLSIGYSSCHWCHVMERQCFEDEEVAEILNNNFISIKVDREERPDVDSVYMAACQALTGSGGWPLSVFLTGDKKPFYAGTYFPKNTQYGVPGFIDVMNSIINVWNDDKDRIIESSKQLSNAISKFVTPSEGEKLSEEFIKNIEKDLIYSYDNIYGGFGIKPKFPTPHKLSFLLKYWKVYKDKKALEIVEKTLQCMYRGGIFDHIGFGFSRYSTDEKWLVPHFEKMLYDNALLSYVYVEAYNETKNELYKEVADKIYTYVLRDMTSEKAGFYSAEDADSEGIEGKFYLWTKDEILDVLGKEKGELFCKYYDVTERGNFEEKNIPNLINQNDDEFIKNDELKNKIENYRKELFEYRERRIHPFKDDKILTSWNGLMIASLAYAGRIFNNNHYIEEAEKSFEFIEENLVRNDGRLLARYREGEAKFLGYLEDYAFLVFGLIELYESSFKTEYLKKALHYNDEMIRLFWDDEKGGLFLYGKDSENLIVKPKEIYDGAIPSGNSVAANNMIMLSNLIEDEELKEKAEQIFKIFGAKVKESPSAHTHYASALLKSKIPGMKIVIVGDNKNRSTEELVMTANSCYHPNKVTILKNGDNEVISLCPYLKNMLAVDKKSTAYVCENFTCHKPILEVKELKKILIQ